jgi:hypothetical protein
MTAQLVQFPPAASHRLISTVTLLHLDGRLFCTAGFLPGDPGAPWAWIQETVSAELECSEDDVHSGESEEGPDTVTVDGIPVYMVEIKRGRPVR